MIMVKRSQRWRGTVCRKHGNQLNFRSWPGHIMFFINQRTNPVNTHNKSSMYVFHYLIHFYCYKMYLISVGGLVSFRPITGFTPAV